MEEEVFTNLCWKSKMTARVSPAAAHDVCACVVVVVHEEEARGGGVWWWWWMIVNCEFF